jgi:hypothetical protein
VEKLAIGIIIVSVMPGVYGWWKSRRPSPPAAAP